MATAFRTLLKNVATGLYADGQGGWTSKDSEACDYKSATNAVKAACEIDAGNLYLVLKFSDSRLDVSHPISTFKSDPPTHGKSPSIIITLLPFAIEAAHHLKSRLN